MGTLNTLSYLGHAPYNVEMQGLMLHDVQLDDFVITIFGQESVHGFIELLPQHLDLGPMQWVGEGNFDVAPIVHAGNELVPIDSRCFPPIEVEILLVDSSKLSSNMGCASTTVMVVLAAEIVLDDEEVVKKEFYLMKKDLAVVCTPE